MTLETVIPCYKQGQGIKRADWHHFRYNRDANGMRLLREDIMADDWEVEVIPPNTNQ